MNRLLIATLLATTMGVSLPLSAQPATPDKTLQAQTAPDISAFDKHFAAAQARMAQMQGLMVRLNATKDPQERRHLLQEHWALMQSGMASMHGLWGPGMMGGRGWMRGPGMMAGPGAMGGPAAMGGPGGPGLPGVPGWGRMHRYYSDLTPEQMKQRQYMTDEYLGLQQQMMEQMLQRQQWMWQPAASTPSK